MLFNPFALLSVAALFSSAATATPTHQVWHVTVGNATGGTIFTPNYIVGKFTLLESLPSR
jgi:hypothetical protein